MTPELSKKVADAWNHWLALSPDERSAYVSQLQKQEPHVAAQLQARVTEHADRPQPHAASEAIREKPHTVDYVPPVPSSQSTVDSVAKDDSQPQSPVHDTMPERAGRYVIEEQIGQGGMGVVWRVRDPEFERTLAVKVMRADAQLEPGAEQRFLDEAKLTGQLQHPGIPPVHDKGHLDDGRPFFTMKLVKGQTLAVLLKERGDRRPACPEPTTGATRTSTRVWSSNPSKAAPTTSSPRLTNNAVVEPTPSPSTNSNPPRHLRTSRPPLLSRRHKPQSKCLGRVLFAGP